MEKRSSNKLSSQRKVGIKILGEFDQMNQVSTERPLLGKCWFNIKFFSDNAYLKGYIKITSFKVSYEYPWYSSLSVNNTQNKIIGLLLIFSTSE